MFLDKNPKPRIPVRGRWLLLPPRASDLGPSENQAKLLVTVFCIKGEVDDDAYTSLPVISLRQKKIFFSFPDQTTTLFRCYF